MIAAFLGILLLGAAQANALEVTVADPVDADEEVVEEAVETIPAAESEPVTEVEETTAATTETVAEVEEETSATTETVAEEAAPETVVATTETAVDAVDATAAKVVKTTETLVQPVAEETTKTVAETTELVTEEVAALTDPGLAETVEQTTAVLSDAIAAAEGIAPDAQPEPTPARPIPATASDSETRFDPGPAWPPISQGDQSFTAQNVGERPAPSTPTSHPVAPGASASAETPFHFDPSGGPEPGLLETVWASFARAGPSPDAAQSIVFLSASLLLIGLVRPRLADWLRLQPLIRRDAGLKLAPELPG